MKSTWKKYLLYGSVIIIGGGLSFILIQTVRAKNTGFETKTLWDWMELLIIPLVLGFGAFFLNRSERAIEHQIAEDRAKVEREIATDRQREAALQSYLDRMADLLLKENLRFSENKEVRNVARIRTLTVLRALDGERKGMLVLFLQEAGLIRRDGIIDLTGADLTKADLERAHLNGANLSGSFLLSAQLFLADLTAADVSGAYLLDVNLTDANLTEANLRDAWLDGANLTGADLTGADLSGATFHPWQLAAVQSLKGTTMPDGTKHD